ncbi:MAG: alpha-amylase family glycosyl hydrolase [Patescibacteria group bacterium]|nr:alpha-amylase family glycosyl hydrolase [Patescibacteria group bacterium]
MGDIPLRSVIYHWESLLYRDPLSLKKNYSYEKHFGYKINSRNEDKTAKEIEFSLYLNNPNQKVILAGEFNNWGETDQEEFTFLETNNNYRIFKTDKIKHKDPYLFLVISDINKELHRDPAATYFDDKGNCVFWDFEDPSSYKQKQKFPNTVNRSTKILQSDLPGLVSKWPGYKGEKDVFKFISDCGVLEKIKELGFNTIQFLPVSQSIDGDNWKFRYLSPFPFALQKNWGDPDSFKKMIDKCHELGIVVILDIILSHVPYKDFKIFKLKGENIGVHTWIDKFKKNVFLDETTTWGSKRFRYQDENIRQYLIESALHFLTKYNIDGYRIDNVDGILRLGPNGEGAPRTGGSEFLKTLIEEIYRINPLTLIHLESHYFYNDNSQMLLAPLESNRRALGASAYNSSRLTYYLHTELMPKSSDDISIWKLENIRREKEWGKSNSTIADFHNHDAAAGLMYGRATGSYAYDALTLNNPDLHKHAIGKIQVMEALIAFGCEGRILDLLQTFLLQKGSFEHESAINWDLLNKKDNLILFKKEINKILDIPAFWPENNINREYINIDEENKVLVISRKDTTKNIGEEYICIINFSPENKLNYSVGVSGNNYEVIFDNKKVLNNEFINRDSDKFELFSKEINIKLEGYHCIVLKKTK